METIDFSDLPKQSSLTLIQKSRAVKKANELLAKGSSKEDAIAGAVGSIQIHKSAESVEQMISYDIIYEPDVRDAHNQWMSKETLVKAQADFKKAQEIGAVTENLYHLFDTDSFKIVDHWIQPEFDVTVSETGEVIKAGSWVAKVQYSPEVWELKKAGIVGGLSLQCGGMLNEETGELYDLDFSISLEDEEE
ncbi:hypothetical protein [Salmonella phage SSBI34]|nr:hypothetical protein [Salmonella phage SSBI34]